MLQDALEYLQTGLCVLPAKRSEKRPAISQWKTYQKTKPTQQQIKQWFKHADALCLVCGAVSGNLEILDFDAKGEAFGEWCQRIDGELLSRLVIERSPSGGYHVLYRCQDTVCGNMKLAHKLDKDKRLIVTIETRGEGGICLTSPTPGYALQRGLITNLPVLTSEEREQLLIAAYECNQYIAASERHYSTQDGSRPGDEFNKRGSVRDILLRHGWIQVKGGQNEYWRRPGKDQGWSATLKDNVFYCFSSNAPPFEPNRAYSAFSVYALLEHDGDYAKAAKTLREQGYGDQQPRIQSTVVTEEEYPIPTNDYTIEEVGSIPEDLLWVPGFVADVMRFCLNNAPYPSIPLAFCGAMALQSFLASRKVREEGGLRPNLYFIALADSGVGKAYPRKINSHILASIGMADALGNQIASGQGLEDKIYATRKVLFQTDEIDNLIEAAVNSKEGHYTQLLSMLLQLYSEADEVHVMRVKAHVQGVQERGAINQPGLVIFGTATPECFFAAMSPKLLINGLFSRSIVVDAGKRGKKQHAHDVSTMPKEIIDVARWWKNYTPSPIGCTEEVQPDLYDVNPTPAIVPHTKEGRAILDELADEADQEYDKAIEKGDQVNAILWTRIHENATRLALVYACSCNHLAPCIDAAAAKWASEFMRRAIRRMLYLANTNVSENPFDALCVKLIKKLRAAPRRELTHSVLMKRMKLDAKTFDLLIDTMVGREEIEIITVKTSTKPLRLYRCTTQKAQ